MDFTFYGQWPENTCMSYTYTYLHVPSRLCIFRDQNKPDESIALFWDIVLLYKYNTHPK